MKPEGLEAPLPSRSADDVPESSSSAAALAFAAAMCVAGHYAFDIRMKAINDYGRVIHEFDPWFNFRALGRVNQ